MQQIWGRLHQFGGGTGVAHRGLVITKYGEEVSTQGLGKGTDVTKKQVNEYGINGVEVLVAC